MHGYKLGAGIRAKRQLKQAAEVLDPLLAPHLDRLDALEARIEALESGAITMTEPAKRGPGRPPKDKE
jgi:hypothetical protein